MQQRTTKAMETLHTDCSTIQLKEEIIDPENQMCIGLPKYLLISLINVSRKEYQLPEIMEYNPYNV